MSTTTSNANMDDVANTINQKLVMNHNTSQEYDLLFLVDATASMGSYLDALNQALPQIIAISKLTNCFARIGILAYRDYECPGGELLEWSGWLTFNETVSQPDLLDMARELRKYGGHSWPEAIKTGLAKSYELMRSDAKTLILLYADAPPHYGRDPRFQENLTEAAALSEVGSYQGCGPVFADWVKGARLLRDGPKIAQVVCVIHGLDDGTRSGVFEFLSTTTNGACLHLSPDQYNARNISQITVDAMVCWMGVEKGGATNAELHATLATYIDQSDINEVKTEDKAHKYITVDDIYSGKNHNVRHVPLTTRVLSTCLQKRTVPVEDLAKMYKSDAAYKALVSTELRQVIINDVTAMSLNPVFGSLWRAFCSDRDNPSQKGLNDLFSVKVTAIRDAAERERMTAWLEESYDYTSEVLETIASVPEAARYPCVCLDPTLSFETRTRVNKEGEEDTRPITEFTRDELLEIGRSCDGRVLKRLGRVLTRLTFINSASEMPAHLAAAGDEVPKIPMALASKEHGQKFWRILLHIVVPGTMLSNRVGSVLAAFTIRLGVQPLMKPAVEQMVMWRDKWNDLEVTETWNINCLSLLIDADNAHRAPDSAATERLLDSGDKELFQRLMDYKMLELNLKTTLTAKVAWTPHETSMPIGLVITCKCCKYPRSVTIMGPGGICGECCYYAENPKEDRDTIDITMQDNAETPAVWFQCNLANCRAQYVVYKVDKLNVKPKCHYCRVGECSAPTVECTKCLSRMIWPEEYRDGDMKDYLCIGCQTCRKTIVDIETNAEELQAENGSHWLIENKNDHIKKGKLFEGMSLYKFALANTSSLETFADNVHVLPGLKAGSEKLSAISNDNYATTAPDRVQDDRDGWSGVFRLYSNGRLVRNGEDLVARLGSWVSRRRVEGGTCSLCFSNQRKNNLYAACGRKGCHQRVCKACLEGWYGLNAPGRILNTAALHCAFCRRAPTAKTLMHNGSGVHAIGQLKAAVQNSGWIYGWCVDCGMAKEYMERVCARGMPEAVEGWSCEHCELAKDPGSQKTKACPACGVMTEKTGGCDHIECVCGAHWCFFCGEEQDEHNIYAHMSAAHGGYYGGQDAVHYESDEDM